MQKVDGTRNPIFNNNAAPKERKPSLVVSVLTKSMPTEVQILAERAKSIPPYELHNVGLFPPILFCFKK